MTRQPWYKQFWPWFLIALPGTVVVACFVTLFIAIRHGDSLVADDYYKEGLAINRRLESEVTARILDVDARLVFDLSAGEVLARLSAEAELPETLRLQLIHPMDSDRDHALTLRRTSPGRYRGALERRPAHRYYVRLTSSAQNPWRLDGEMNFSRQSELRLNPHG